MYYYYYYSAPIPDERGIIPDNEKDRLDANLREYKDKKLFSTKPNRPETLPAWLQEILKDSPKLPGTVVSDLTKAITQKELDLAYTTCGISTAPGPSGMRYSQWIKGPGNFQTLTLELFNHILNTGAFPKDAKAGIILPIPKNPLEPCTPENARPLTMLETGLKLFNTIIANRIKASLNRHPIFFPIQDAFLPNRNIDDSLHILNEVISDANRFDKELHIVYLDLKQAFDRAEFWMSNIALVYCPMVDPSPRIKLERHNESSSKLHSTF